MPARSVATVATLVLFAILSPSASAQTSAPHILHTDVDPGTGVLTIAGTGLGPDLTVLIEGHAVPVLPGATDTALQAFVPAALQGRHGSSRVVVFDRARNAGDAFVFTGVAPVVPGGSRRTPARAERSSRRRHAHP